MRLTKVQITNYRSIQDSSEFDIDDVTCLVGKNESGKTALLRALHKLNPVEQSSSYREFNVDNEFPRSDLVEYKNALRRGVATHRHVVRATFLLGRPEIDAIRNNLGQDCLMDQNPTLILFRGYDNTLKPHIRLHNETVINHLIESADLPTTTHEKIRGPKTISDSLEVLRAMESPTPASTKLIQQLEFFEKDDQANFSATAFEFIKDFVPKFLYFDDYYQITGQENLEELRSRFDYGELQDSDLPFIGLVQLAGLELEDLSVNNPTTTRVAMFEAASNSLTRQITPYWSQNPHIRIKFEVHPASPQDPPGMREGTNVWGFVEDTIHQASTELSARSKGFVWFFSFMAWYSSLREENENLILLLDEPGLSLHGKAQADLLRYIEEQLKPQHQVIYTTHSPFMVDSNHLERVRIVQDKSSEQNPGNQTGVKVTTDVLEAASVSLFP